MTGQAKSLAVDSRVVHYLEAGIGPLVVLVHGSLSDQRYWSPQMQPLGALYRVVAPSLRHHHPGAPAGHAPADYGVQQHAEDLVALVQALDAGTAHLVGHSRGAHVCAFAAIERPDLFASLALADPALRLGEDADPLTLPAERRDVIERIRRGDVDGGLEAFIDAVSGPGTWKRLNSRRRQIARDNAWTLPAQYDDPELAAPVAGLSALAMPVLLVGGGRSPAPHPTILLQLAKQLPAARKQVLPMASHAMNAEDAAGFNQRMLEFRTAP